MRHGEPEGGVKYPRQCGRSLSATGWQQMRATVTHSRLACSWDADCLAHGAVMPLPARVAQQQNLPLTVLPDLRELCFGEPEGMTPKAAWAPILNC
ncbi:MAG: histidine phosphatase family protein [Gammaproteobacteria bacterium]